jgi:hypothetical protein
MEKKCHYLEFMKGDISLCGHKSSIKNANGKGFREIYGFELTFDKKEVTCEKCIKILKQNKAW